jgi:Flp pilus assembly protein TadG
MAGKVRPALARRGLRRARASHPAERERGAALVEFAIVLPLLLLLIWGLIDFGMYINRVSMLNNAAREGARVGVFGPDPDEIEDRVREASSDFDQADLTVEVDCEKPDGTACPGVDFDSEWESGDMLIVTVNYAYDFMTPMPRMIGIGSSRTISSTVEMRIE